MLGYLEIFNTIVALVGLSVCALIWFRNRARTRQARLRVIFIVLAGTLALMWWCSYAGWDKWNILMSVGTVLAVIVALFLDDIRSLLHFPEIHLHVGQDLLDIANDFDSDVIAHWVRGRITNTGDRGVERCRVKLLKVEGPELPHDVRRVENGFLQWQGGIRDSMRLNPGEYWIFDIGTRSYRVPGIPLRLCAHFVRGPQAPLISCSLQAPGTYTITLAIYGDNIQSREQSFCITIGAEEPDEIQFST